MGADSPWEHLARGVPLEPEAWYLSPVAIEPRADGSESLQVQQGDVFRRVPHLRVSERPVRAFYDESGANQKRPYRLAAEDDLYDQAEGDALAFGPVDHLWPGVAVASAEIGLGIVLSQDCELQKRRPTLIFARVRPITVDVERTHIELIRNRGVYRSFYLPASTSPVPFPASIVDFGRLTTLQLPALRLADRLLSLHDEVRDCLRRDFVAFLMADREDDA